MTTDDLPEGARVELLSMVWRAHRESAMVNDRNVSSSVAALVGGGSGNVSHAVCAAMLSFGGVHAPITVTRHTLFARESPPEETGGALVPGFGNSFHSNQVDPIWQPLADKLALEYPAFWSKVLAWSDLLRKEGKAYFPNAAAITATVAEIVGWPWGVEFVLVCEPRMIPWVLIAGRARPTKGWV